MTDPASAPVVTRARVLTLGTALLLAYAGVEVSALLGAPWAFLGFVAVAHALDVVVEDTPALYSVLRASQLGISNRGLLRDLAFVLLAARVSWSAPHAFWAVTLCALAMPLWRTTYLALIVPLRRRLLAPIVVRNVDVTGLRVPTPPPRVVLERPAILLHHLGILVLLAGAVAAATGVVLAFFVVVALALAVTTVGVVLMLRALLRSRGTLRDEALLAAVADRLHQLRPEVVLYFSGTEDSVYQVNTWLSTMDRLTRRGLIVLRERRLLPLLGATETPVVCIPSSVDFMNFPLPDIRVALYPTNVGKNIHLLRVPGVKHVFIGHGDSDKVASFNPFSKVYSEIWVAGPAGRDRYVRANVGVRAEDVVEVGRPQLDAVQPASASPPRPLLTVLYAPTWEGWTDDPYATSLVVAGARIIEQLLAASPPVRVIYKPHPLTGTVSAAAAQAHTRVVTLLGADIAARRADPRLAALSGARPPAVDRAVLELPYPATDAGRPASPREQEERYRAWSAAWWPSQPVWAHRVVTGVAPTLYDCFNAADVLIADISSVVSDFLASQKPYVVTNLTGLPDDEFRESYPSAAGGYLLDAGADALGSILELARGADPMAARRRACRAYLLGGDEPDALTRFDRAVDRAVREAQRTWPQREMVTAVAGI